MAEEEIQTQIKEAETAIMVAEEAIEKAKAAGIDTTDLEKDLEEAKTTLKKLKEAFGE